MNCDCCDYYKVLCPKSGRKEAICMCGFTGVIFACPIDELDMEYPCRNVTFGEYENRMRDIQCVRRLEKDDWRLIYKKTHLNEATCFGKRA